MATEEEELNDNIQLQQSNEKKSVTFSTSTCGNESHILNASDCLNYMRKGSALIKLRTSGRQYKRTFYLDEQMRCIRWVSSSKRHARAQIHLTEIHDVQLGCSARATHSLTRRRQRSVTSGKPETSHPYGTEPLNNSHHVSARRNNTVHSHTLTTQLSPMTSPGNSSWLTLSSNTFTISYGPEFDSLELLANSPEEANIWVTGIKCLMAGAQDPHMLAERQKPRDRWLQRVFTDADQARTGYLDEHQILRLMQRINPYLSERHVRQQWKECDRRSREFKGRLNVTDFITFFKKLSTRQEIYHLLVRYSSGSELLTQNDLRHFIESEQGQIGVNTEKCLRYIEDFEPSEENRALGLMGIDGFTAFLLSRECDIFDSRHLGVCQDMSQPITHYYIAASHKTFLLEDQLTGPCSIEGYRRALLSGCRYIEVEVHDGHDGSPVISRSNSRASGIPAQDVLGTIGDLAFQRSDYPLIISIECFASPHQQFTLANLLVYYLGQRILPPSSQFEFTLGEAQLEVEEHVEKHFDPYRKNSLTTVDLSNEATLYSNDGLHVRWPSPRDLIGRILLKGKRLPKGYSSQVGSDVGVGADVRGAPFRSFSHSVYQPQSSTVIKELSDLFFFDCTNCTSFSTKSFRKSNPSLTINSTNATSTHSSAQLLTKTNPHLKTGPSLLVVGTHNEMGFPGRRMASGITTGSSYDKCFSKTDVSRVHPYHFIQLSETEASKALGQAAGELVQITRNSFFEIVPSPSRADSSNLNPIDIWAWGGQVVPLNYQTAGLVMDLATGFFARNGACGYVLKPALYRQVSSFFSPFSSHSELHQKPPDTTPQIFRLKILSAQQLPKPRGSVSKGDTIEPYVVVEIHGIPVDCEEQRTPTAPAGNASGYSATFNETFEFCVQLGSLALVRFVVLDDHAIGDDFIGQNTIPFDCLLSGYRHVRLRGDTGEPIPLATLFIHVTITSRTEEGSDVQATGVLQRWRTKKRQHIQLKKVGASNFDEIFKTANSCLLQSVELRCSLQTAFSHFRHACGETSSTMSMAQCIRSLSSRLQAACGNPSNWPIRMRIRAEDDMPHLELQTYSLAFGSNLSAFPSLSTLGDSGSRSSSTHFSPSPGLHRSPSTLLGSNRSFLHRRFNRETRSIDEDTNSALSIDAGSEGLRVEGKAVRQDSSPFNNSLSRRTSMQSSTSSISSLSMGGVEKMRRTVTEFESFIEATKLLIKQGPYLRVKLQHAQRSALDAYTTFLDCLREPSGGRSEFSPLRTTTNTLNTDTLSSRRFPFSTASLKRHELIRPDAHVEETRTAALSGSSMYRRKMSRIADSVTWNLRLLTGQAEQLTITLNDLSSWLRQARETGAVTGLLNTAVSSSSVGETADKLDSLSFISGDLQDSASNPAGPANASDEQVSPTVSNPLECVGSSNTKQVETNTASKPQLSTDQSNTECSSELYDSRIRHIRHTETRRDSHTPAPNSSYEVSPPSTIQTKPRSRAGVGSSSAHFRAYSTYNSGGTNR